MLNEYLYVERIDEQPSKVVLLLRSAEADPVPYARQLIELRPYLKVAFYYEGDGYRGQVEGRNGIVTRERYAETPKKFVRRNESDYKQSDDDDNNKRRGV